ncbi:hypothetical protein T4D_5756 [Trichinella pseudospiralis]|uniref:Uncharacterized protein n=1 Tax=Trichinella pseudospiralis TaxID=6337 RepID=A0A0V1F917_TRIPS|nr:hypothetical protein T4D_5756 [Trichinella pseudospiralis]
MQFSTPGSILFKTNFTQALTLNSMVEQIAKLSVLHLRKPPQSFAWNFTSLAVSGWSSHESSRNIPIACQQFQNGSCQQDVVSEVFMNTVTNHTAKYVSGKRDSYASRFIRTNRCRSDEEMPSQLR